MNQDQWKNKNAVITGAASGLGNALAQKLLTAGATVALFDLDKSALEQQFRNQKNCVAYSIDVTNFEEVKKAVDDFANKNSKIDILVNCAAITGKTNVKSHEVDLENFDRVMAINVRGSLNTSKAVLPYMLEQAYGRILHVASIAGKDGNAGMLAYSSSKAAVIGMAKVQGKEYAESGITVNALAPAVIKTKMVEDLPDKQVKYMTDKIPMKRCGTLDEFVGMASFIVSEENSFSTGFTYDLSGGRAVY
ncbi:MAG: SDR family NAD(P)-dependent oxidoreductase [Planktomarina sp.]|nr:SDR family NAD(P)-dependent oxidoreductase [Planktomarina sp.]|tara:strand:- start:1421 stop:2167 length:747 start_codon:yes stop_codon:yes gene_type:complete